MSSDTYNASIAVAAKKIGVSVKEYERRRSLGEKWCSGCIDWHPEGEFSSPGFCRKALRDYRLRRKEAAEHQPTAEEVLLLANKHIDAVAKMCRSCEPEGVCRTPDCPLQVAGVSPLPRSTRQRFSAA